MRQGDSFPGRATPYPLLAQVWFVKISSWIIFVYIPVGCVWVDFIYDFSIPFPSFCLSNHVQYESRTINRDIVNLACPKKKKKKKILHYIVCVIYTGKVHSMQHNIQPPSLFMGNIPRLKYETDRQSCQKYLISNDDVWKKGRKKGHQKGHIFGLFSDIEFKVQNVSFNNSYY